ncbi:MAG TPA: dienelactone hydrolase family protein [Planctomycetaceae bacterium]|nr:dienelactone hydrolase family protein [Planctomycetaceae bacterium]
MLRSLWMLCAIGLTVLSSVPVDAAVKTKSITYKDGDQECVGFLAWNDSASEKSPGVLVVHEWWGLNDYARDRAKQLAELGYVAFACDMYGDGKVTEHPKDAQAMATETRRNVAAWRKRAQAGLAVLKAQPTVKMDKIAAMGYCFGGSTALQLAYSGEKLEAVATFHAALPAPTAEEAKQIRARILVCHGADDSFIPPAAVTSFKKALDDAAVVNQVVSYPGAVHSFTVPDADKHNIPGMKYNKTADEESWKQMKQLFAEMLQTPSK